MIQEPTDQPDLVSEVVEALARLNCDQSIIEMGFEDTLGIPEVIKQKWIEYGFNYLERGELDQVAGEIDLFQGREAEIPHIGQRDHILRDVQKGRQFVQLYSDMQGAATKLNDLEEQYQKQVLYFAAIDSFIGQSFDRSYLEGVRRQFAQVLAATTELQEYIVDVGALAGQGVGRDLVRSTKEFSPGQIREPIFLDGHLDRIKELLTRNENLSTTMQEKMREFDALLDAMDKLVQYRPGLEANYQYLEDKIGEGQCLLGQYQEAIQYISTTITANARYDEMSTESILDEGVHLRENREYIPAIVAFEAALARTPDSADAYVNLAMTYRDMGNKDDAKRLFNRVLEINPDHGFAARNLEALR